jgi:L-rhamnose mutarotase
MERLCFVISVVRGAEEEFDRRHAEIWPEMSTAMRAAGYSNYSLFRRDQTVIGYAECHPSVESAAASMAAKEVAERWNASMVGLVDYPGAGPSLVRFEEVWHLAE